MKAKLFVRFVNKLNDKVHFFYAIIISMVAYQNYHMSINPVIFKTFFFFFNVLDNYALIRSKI